jgi:hypothetical protein
MNGAPDAVGWFLCMGHPPIRLRHEWGTRGMDWILCMGYPPTSVLPFKINIVTTRGTKRGASEYQFQMPPKPGRAKDTK